MTNAVLFILILVISVVPFGAHAEEGSPITYYCEHTRGDLDHRSFYHFPDLENNPAYMLLNTWRSKKTGEFHDWNAWNMQYFLGYSETTILLEMSGSNTPLVGTLERETGAMMLIYRSSEKPDESDEVFGTGQCKTVDTDMLPIPVPSVSEYLE